MSEHSAILPTRRDEAWRYGDLAALERVWPQLRHDGPERIDVAAGETAIHVIDTIETVDGVGIVDLDIRIAEGARCDLFCLLDAADYGRVNVRAELARGAHFELGGAILGRGKQTLEIVTEVVHADPQATSNQVVRSVLGEQATGNFLGKVHVARHAQQTDAEQSVKAMLLDRSATANAVPQLEIFADDVQCAHGATVGELDKAALFYMAARGLPPAIAKRLMLQAFIAESFRNMTGDAAREDIEKKALLALEAML